MVFVVPLVSVLSSPSWSRQMAALPESGSAKGFFLLKGSRREVSVQSAVFELALYV